MRLESTTIRETLPFGPFRISILFSGIWAYIAGSYGPNEYHEVERGHWANGYMPGTGELSLDADTVEVEEFELSVPALSKWVGPHLAATVCAWIAERYDERLKGYLTDLLQGSPEDFEWSE